MRQLLIRATLLLFSLNPIKVIAEPPQSIPTHFDNTEEWVDAVITRALNTLHIPGVAVGIVKDGNIVLSKGYGVRSLTTQEATTEDTLFAIASCTKAFTSFALGQLVDQGKIDWDDPVIKHLPTFKLNDQKATNEITIRDLLLHRSGFPRHDFVWYNSKLSKSELLNRMQFLDLSAERLERFQYSNLMYLVAGLVIEQVTGQSWEAYIQEHIFDPLKMTHSNCSVVEMQLTSNYAVPHGEVNNNIQPVPFRDVSIVGPACAINSSVSDLLKWTELHLNGGVYEDLRLIEKETLEDLLSFQMPCYPPFSAVNPHLYGYGLGWLLGYHQGLFSVCHGGSIDGFRSWVVLLPNENIGVIVLVNSNYQSAFSLHAAYAIANTLLGNFDHQWLHELEGAGINPNIIAPSKKAGEVKLLARPRHDYVGVFVHPGYGSITIFESEDCLCASINELTMRLVAVSPDQFSGLLNDILPIKFDFTFVQSDSAPLSELLVNFEYELPPIRFKRAK